MVSGHSFRLDHLLSNRVRRSRLEILPSFHYSLCRQFPFIWYFFPKTKGRALEEIGKKFGDEVVIHLTGLSDEQKEDLDKAIEMERKT
jgi:hypothetical protein